MEGLYIDAAHLIICYEGYLLFDNPPDLANEYCLCDIHQNKYCTHCINEGISFMSHSNNQAVRDIFPSEDWCYNPQRFLPPAEFDPSLNEYCLSDHSIGVSQKEFLSGESMEPLLDGMKKERVYLRNTPKLKGIKEGKLVGFYTQRERKARITKFKRKIGKWLLTHTKRRNLIGRSEVARLKTRYDGKFCSSNASNSEACKVNPGSRILSDEEIIRRNQELSMYEAQGDLNMIVNLAIDSFQITQ